ncbi:hypothetical protein K7432_004046 [Basidiobolus ranarum]|uniref:Ankyrin n=1 Tax=Basidiobolus ranarum TaxID=34480 RepID=A0ABR2W677_9FUNG
MTTSPVQTLQYTPVASMIPEMVYPPVPGETHAFYGDHHNKGVKLPDRSHLKFNDSNLPNPLNSEIPNQIQKEINERLYIAAETGDANVMSELLEAMDAATNGSPSGLINTPSPSTGLTALHYAASRGHLTLVQLLVDSGSIVELPDKEGETALLKAAYNGYLSVIKYLVEHQADVNHKDNDGWTALHNACSRGQLDVVRWLIEISGADVNIRSKMGHTPLINAASKGYLHIVRYLLRKGKANPLIKNKFGEAAYDVAAVSMEAQVCELLERAEKDWWRAHRKPSAGGPPVVKEKYDMIASHNTILVILHENQRSTSSFRLRFTAPKFSISALSKSDIRGPWSLTNGEPKDKEDIHLPTPPESSQSTSDSWFWLTDWQVDIKHLQVDPEEGWQYSRSFDCLEKEWTPSAPGAGSGGSWVRRRRWFRAMKRQVDVAQLTLDESDDNISFNSQEAISSS